MMGRLIDTLILGCVLSGTVAAFFGLALCAWLGYEVFARGAAPCGVAKSHVHEERFYERCEALAFTHQQCVFMHCGVDGCEKGAFHD